jgi:hypothetical protein
MESIGEIFTAFNELALVAGTLVAAVFFFFRSIFAGLGTALLAALGRGAGFGIGQRLSPGAQAGRRLPLSPRQRLARQALFEAEARQVRIESYVGAYLELMAERAGPFALSALIAGRIEPGFAEKYERFVRRTQEFDRLEEKAQRALQRFEADYARHCEPIRDELRQLGVELTRWKARGRRFAWQPWRRRWRYYKRRMLSVRRRIFLRQLRLQSAELKLNMSYRATLEPALVEVDRYERAYLTHWIHSFEADLESLRLTVVSGRLIEHLATPQNSALREKLQIGGLPAERASLERELRAFLAERGVGLPPEASIAGLLEAYLRLRLLEDEAMRAAWGVDRTWLEHDLPPPGELGIAQERWLHLSRAWPEASPRALPPARPHALAGRAAAGGS